VENASKIKWYPPHMQQRLIDWASSLDWDWVISRQRIFGTPFPLWYCKACKEVILADKSALPIDPTQTAPDKPCPKCGSHEYIPEMDGMDTWMDSSITIAVHAGWPDDPNWTKYFPADIQPNGTDIIRTWDYYLLLRHLMLFDQIPFKAVLINGMVTGEDGRKMSKSLNNFVTTESAVKEYGVDALRQWAAAGGSVGSDIPFTWKEVKHAFRFLVKYWNAIRFVSMHLKEYRLKEPVKLNPFDRWILEKLNNVIIDVTKNMEEYRFNIALNTLRSFIWHDFCDNYLECVKYRLYDKTIAQSEIESAKYTLATVINTTLKLFAPFIPFFTEEVYNNLFTTKFQSIHLTTWPEKLDIKEELEKLGDIAIEIIKTVRKLKSRANQPLNKEIDWIKVRSSNYALKMFIEDIRRTIKAKEIQIKEGTTGYPVSDDLFLEISPIECKKCKKKTYDLAQGKCMAC
jgi:valyl-tRNA synthetase